MFVVKSPAQQYIRWEHSDLNATRRLQELHHSSRLLQVLYNMCKACIDTSFLLVYMIHIHFSPTVLEFELRRAKETIKELRENLTEYAQGNFLKDSSK